MVDLSTPPAPAHRTIGRASRQVRGLQRLCAQLPDAALLWLGGRVRHVNAGARALLGCNSGALGARTLDSLLAALPRMGPAAGSGVVTVLGARDEVRTLRVSVLLQQRGGPRAQLWLLHDISAEYNERARLQRAHDRLARLSAAVDAEQQRRRRETARRVHDELLQPLVAIRLNLEAATAVSVPGALPAAGPLQAAIGVVQTAIEAGRDVVRSLGSPILVELGLAAALEALSGDFARRHHIRCRFRMRGGELQDRQASPAVLQCLYRVAEEALDNIARHARARHVDLGLAVGRQGCLLLRVHDDGVGMSPHDRDDPLATGLLVLRQRLLALGGRLVLRSAPGAGTTLTARCPHDVHPASAAGPQDEAPEAALIRFFYRAPVGLVQAAPDGRIELMNPLAAGWLLPLSPDGRLDNLFSVLGRVAPQLQARALAQPAPDGVLCEAWPILREGAQPVWLTISRQAGGCWMAVLGLTPTRGPTDPAGGVPPSRAHAASS